MLLFRSEEHLNVWLEQRGMERGGTMTIEQQVQLGERWYAGRLEEGWRRRTPQESQEVLASVGLTGDFWQLG